jgi:hypothetical protein
MLSRDDLVALGGFDKFAVKRWETGASIQTPVEDRFLRLIDEAVIQKLRHHNINLTEANVLM